MQTTIAAPATTARAPAPPRARIPDDATMLRTVVELTRDLATANPRIFWSDLIASAMLGYGGMAGAILLPGVWAWIAAAVSVLALYRAGSFIHELTHMKHRDLPWFRFGWNALIGVPLLIPSFLYEGVHTIHHARTRYGTMEDPEYLPLALMKPWTVPVFVIVSAFAPIALLFRFAVLTPLGALIPAVRTFVRARYSALAINPSFRRRPADGDLARMWNWQEGLASAWAIALIALVATGALPLRAFAIMLAIVGATLMLNQVRTLVAHLWENEGEPMTVTAQFLDSVNVPPPAMLPALWAPVGLRYHALHHLLPSTPYHALGEAHRRISGALGVDSTYARVNYRGLTGLVAQLVRGARG